MANLRNHEVVEIWKSKSDEYRIYHVTENNRLLRSTGPRGGGLKIAFINESAPGRVDGKHMPNFHGKGRRATATELRWYLEKFAVKMETV